MADDRDSTTDSTPAPPPICVNAVPAVPGSGSPPSIVVNTCALRTRHDWCWIALCNAFGRSMADEIQGGTVWAVDDPQATFPASKDIIRNVYDYYGALNKRNPQKCIWAGLARVAGGPFFGGFCKIDEIERTAKGYLDRCEHPPASFWESLGREDCESGSLFLEENQTYEECQASISALMAMGRHIFNDLAWQHEAYLAGGLTEILRLAQSGQFGAGNGFADATECVDVWTTIDKDDDGAWSGNLRLFEREQLATIPFGYRRLEGQFAVPTILNYLAKSPHPWGRSFDDFYNQFPTGSHGVTNDRDRWTWMRDEVYPTWRKAGDGKRNTLIGKTLDDLVAGVKPAGP
jgi:hypothetical protein